MSVMPSPAVEQRARQSLGASHDAIYRMVARVLEERGVSGGRLIDVGCGSGALWKHVRQRFHVYCGLDAVCYDGLPPGTEFRQVDLDTASWPVADHEADAVVAVETIEHLENPWAFMRSLARLAKPGGTVVVTTPNQLSALSLLTLVSKRRFSAFQDVHYPTHRTALLESDLRRMAAECELQSVTVEYSLHGRLPLGPWHYPRAFAAIVPRLLSDNLLLAGRAPGD